VITSRRGPGNPPPSFANPAARPLHPSPFDLLQALLARRPHRLAAPAPGLPAASVALVLRPGADGPELLLIRRAERTGDPWSGHMALPGGRAEPEDAGAEATAARETEEEVGIRLAEVGRLLGPLDEVRPVSQRAPKVVVSAFVYAVPAGTLARPNEEVALALWVPLAELASPAAVTEFIHTLEDGTAVRFPAFGTGGQVVWGLTHRILTGFLRLYHDAVHNA
jgi:8-oxo-dGTP pyrophosphatase MutT (NUDIX family)